jgi:hypothetical protein
MIRGQRVFKHSNNGPAVTDDEILKMELFMGKAL